MDKAEAQSHCTNTTGGDVVGVVDDESAVEDSPGKMEPNGDVRNTTGGDVHGVVDDESVQYNPWNSLNEVQ